MTVVKSGVYETAGGTDSAIGAGVDCVATGATTAADAVGEPDVGTFNRCGRSLAPREAKLGATELGTTELGFPIDVAVPVPGSFVGGAFRPADCARADVAPNAESVSSAAAIDNRAGRESKFVGPPKRASNEVNESDYLPHQTVRDIQ